VQQVDGPPISIASASQPASKPREDTANDPISMR
jgi:hypothetical protein